MKAMTIASLVLLVVASAACSSASGGQPAATPTPTAIPPTAVPPTAAATAVPPTQAPTAKPLGEHVIAEWKIDNPSGVFFGFDSVWVPGHHDFTTTRIDRATNKIIAVIKGTGDHADQALAVGGALWVTGQHDDTNWIDPKTNTVKTTVPQVEGDLHGIAFGFNSIWATTDDNKLDRIDPATRQIITSIPLENGYIDWQNFVVVTPRAVWVYQLDKTELIKVDPSTNSVVSKTPWATLIEEAKAQTTVPAGKGTDFIWISIVENMVAGTIAEGLLRIDPNTGAGLTFLPLSPEQQGDAIVAVADDAVWVGGLGQINRVNVATNQIDKTYKTDTENIIDLAVGFGSVWLVSYDKNLVERLDIAP